MLPAHVSVHSRSAQLATALAAGNEPALELLLGDGRADVHDARVSLVLHRASAQQLRALLPLTRRLERAKRWQMRRAWLSMGASETM
jgi:hypothetical protein